MSNAIPLQLIYLTLPESPAPVLNIRPDNSEELYRFTLTRAQMFQLNAQTADALMKGQKK